MKYPVEKSNDILNSLEEFTNGGGVYLTHDECNIIKTELINNIAYIKYLETQIEKLIREQQENITGIGQC